MFEEEKKKNIFERKQKLFLLSSIALFLSLCVLYIMQVNAASTKAFLLRDEERKYTNLSEENNRLLAEIDRLRSMSSLMERQIFLGLVPASDIRYISSEQINALALRE